MSAVLSHAPFWPSATGVVNATASQHCTPFQLSVHWRAMSIPSVAEFFHALPTKLDSEAAEGLAVVYQFDLTGPAGGQYYVVIEDSACQVGEGIHPAPHVTLSLSGDDCMKVLNGRLDRQSAFMSGRVRVSGDFALALQLRLLFPSVA